MVTHRGVCRHCEDLTKLYCRRLCPACWHNPAIRDLYPSLKRRRTLQDNLPACKHCQTNPATASRGLCSACHHRKDIRVLYPPKSIWRPVQPEPTQPTKQGRGCKALPGSREKIRVLAARFAHNLKLHHPADKRLSLE